MRRLTAPIPLGAVLTLALLPAAAAADGRARIAACPHSRTSATQVSAKVMRAAIVCLVNQERKRFHLPLMHENAKLDHSAQAHSDDMVRRDYFSHYSPDGSSPSHRIHAAGYRWSWSGENIASGYATPAEVMTAWMSDVGHCQNILRPQFADIGVGVNPHGIARYNTGPATWTQDFGLKQGARVPSNNSRPANGCPRGI